MGLGTFLGNVLRECSSGMFFGNVLQECSSRMFSAIFVLRPFPLRRVYFRHARTPGGIPDITDVCNVLALTKIFCVARFIRSVQKTSRFASSPDFHARSTRWSVALCAVCDPCGDSSLTVSLGGAHQVDKNGPGSVRAGRVLVAVGYPCPPATSRCPRGGSKGVVCWRCGGKHYSRAALEAVGVVHEHNFGNGSKGNT